MSRWGFLQKPNQTAGCAASRISFLLAMSALCALGDCEMSPNHIMVYLDSRTPRGRLSPAQARDSFVALSAPRPPLPAIPLPSDAPPPAPAASQVPSKEGKVLGDDAEEDN